MLFEEARLALEAGKFVTRTGWTDGSYLALLPGMVYIWKVCHVPNPAAGNWLPFSADLGADDWLLLSDVKPPEVAPVPPVA